MTYKLREFTCKECRHIVIVNPNLPADYTPNTCMECYERGAEKRKLQEFRLMGEAMKLCRLLGAHE